MSAVVESPQCFPKALTIGTFTFPAPEACHERCPGGQTIPGVMGGWVCPCECHRGTPVVPELIDGYVGGSEENRGSSDPSAQETE